MVGIELFAFEAGELNGWFMPEASVWPHKVIVDDKQRGQSTCAIEIFEAGSWSSMELVGAVQPFYKLLVFSIGFTFGVEVLKPYDGTFGENLFAAIFGGFGIIGDNCAVIGRQAIGYKFGLRAFWGVRRAIAVVNERKSGSGPSAFREVPSADCATYF